MSSHVGLPTTNIKETKSMVREVTCTPSMTQRSPTSKGCITNTNMMASNTVLAVLPKINTTRRSWDEMNTSTWVVKNPIKTNQIMMFTRITITETSLFSSSTAVLVSVNERASDFRSR